MMPQNSSDEPAHTDTPPPRPIDLSGATQSIALRIADAVTLLLFVAVVFLHWRAASVATGSSLSGDQPKHFTSGVMVYDYLRFGLSTNPIRFAESFEVRYPLVAIGHWPPMYYAVQALFYFLTGPYILGGQVLSAVMTAYLAVLIFMGARRQTGTRIALIACTLFLATPLMQVAAWQIMSDLLTGLFVFLAILAFAKLLDAPGNWKAAAAFALYAIAAILTKGSAWALGPFFLVAPLLCRRVRFFRSLWFLGSIFAVILLGSCFYIVADRTGIGYPAHYAYFLSLSLHDRAWNLLQLLKFAPPLLIVLSALGFAEAVYTRWGSNEHDDLTAWTTLSLVAGAWIASQILFLFILPMTPEPRVLLPSLAPAALLAARSLVWIQRSLKRTPLLAMMSPVVVGAMFLVDCRAVVFERLDGYRQAANAMPYPPEGALILVAMDTGFGEEATITERLSHDRAHRDVILRGSHVLAEIDPTGKDRSRFQNAEAVHSYLLQMPIRFLVLSKPPFNFSYQALLESAVAGDPQNFHLLATVQTSEQPNGHVGELRIYENPAGRDHHPSIVQTPLGYDAGRRVLEYRWK